MVMDSMSAILAIKNSRSKITSVNEIRNIWWLLREEGKEIMLSQSHLVEKVSGNKLADQAANMKKTTPVVSINKTSLENTFKKTRKKSVWKIQ